MPVKLAHLHWVTSLGSLQVQGSPSVLTLDQHQTLPERLLPLGSGGLPPAAWLLLLALRQGLFLSMLFLWLWFLALFSFSLYTLL